MDLRTSADINRILGASENLNGRLKHTRYAQSHERDTHKCSPPIEPTTLTPNKPSENF